MCYYESGSSNEVTLVFSCPGQKEMKLKRPAAGKTGKNLDIVLKNLDDYKGIKWNRKSVTITNSWPNIEYNKFTGRSEATKHEIIHSDNLDRLYDDIKVTTKYIICFGENANYAVNQINRNLQATIITARHLSSRNLNANIKEDINGNIIKKGTTDIEKEINTNARLEVVAKEIKEEIEKLESN